MKIKIEDIKQIVEEVVQDAISEQEQEEVPASPQAAQPNKEKQKADVGVILKYIEKINNVPEYIQLLTAILKHIPGGDAGVHKRAVLAVFKELGITSSAVQKVQKAAGAQ